MHYKKKDYAHMARVRARAIANITKALGKDHPITHMVGPMAWHRNPWEQGPDTTLAGYVEEKAGLDGCVHILKAWCNEYRDLKALRVIIELYPSAYSVEVTR